MEEYDLAVLGGGPGGYVAAIRAAQLGKKVVLIERENLGGVCLNWGCIPTKALLKSAEVYSELKNSANFGIIAESINPDIKKIVARSRSISAKLTGGIKSLIKKNKITLKEGNGYLEGKNIVSINKTEKIKSSNIIIATGARSRILPGFEPDGDKIWTSKEAMIPSEIPKSITIVGSGAIGVEFASFYNTLGSNVTILEAQNKILPVEDVEISSLAHKIFEKKNINIELNVKLQSKVLNDKNISIAYEVDGKKINLETEKLLMAVGITANTENIGLENTKIKLEKGHILTNSHMQTDEQGIYAIGDVTQGPWLAHKASHEAIIAVESMFGIKTHGLNKLNIPGCTYSSPQIASVGLTEVAAKEQGFDIRVGRFPFMANGKALVLEKPEGLIKTIFDNKTGELLGAHMIGAEVTELIQGYVVTKNLEGTELDLMNTIFPHPTLSEMMHESVLDAYEKALHI